MTPEVHYAITILVEFLWIPVLLKFFVAWRQRRNPISLAIVGLIALMMLLALNPIWLLHCKVDAGTLLTVNQVLSAVVAANFYIAFRISRKLFRDERRG